MIERQTAGTQRIEELHLPRADVDRPHDDPRLLPGQPDPIAEIGEGASQRHGVIQARGVYGERYSSGLSQYMPGLPYTARDCSTSGGSQGIGSGEDTVSRLRHSSSRAAIGSLLAPPSTAAVIAPIEMPVTAIGSKPGRRS